MSKELISVLNTNQKNIKQISMNYVLTNPNEFNNLIKLSFGTSQPEGWRSAWVLAELVKKHKGLLQKIAPYSSKIIDSFTSFKHSGQSREYMKVVQLLDLSEEEMGVLLNLCFDWLIDKNVDVAIRVHCMQIIFDYSRKEPDLGQELRLILEQEMEYGTPGFKGRAKKILGQIDKYKK